MKKIAPSAAVARRELSRLDKDFEDRDAFSRILETGGEELQVLAHDLGDPANRGVPLHEICRTHGVPVRMVLETYYTGLLLLTRISVARKVADEMPKVVASILSDAEGGPRDCWYCEGIGTKNDLPCSLCGGQGRVRKEGDPKARDQALLLSGFKNEKASSKTAVQVNVGKSPRLPSYETSVAEAVETDFKAKS